MKKISQLKYMVLLSGILIWASCLKSKPVRLSSGNSFAGWEGDTINMWRIKEGIISAGSGTEIIPHNDFLTTRRDYGDFILKFKFKLLGKEGFINGGVQFRSRRIIDPPYEMQGYQADIGLGYYGALYDESRRNKILMGPDSLVAAGLVKTDDWNDYEIRAEGNRIQLFLNDRQTVNYTEDDPSIPATGLIGLQVHGGGKTVIQYKDISIVEMLK